MNERQYYEKLEQHQVWSSNQQDNGALNIVCSDLLPNMQACDLNKIFVDYNHKDVLNIKTINKVVLWGSLYNTLTARALKFALDNKLPIEIWENGFIRSVKGWNVNQNQFTNGYSFIKGIIPYFDTISNLKNNVRLDIENYRCSIEDKALARIAIDFIIKHNLTKYNHQPNVKLGEVGRVGKKKILLVDQSYKDMSVSKCGANDLSFIDMVQDAMLEDDAVVYLKLHPDTISGQRGGYFGINKIQELIRVGGDRVVLINYESNPIDTIRQVDEVWCVSSQFGFEALMCGKKVKCYSNPIYRCVVDGLLSVEEFFYIMYIKNTIWVDVESKEIVDIMTFLKGMVKLIKQWKKSEVK